MASRATFLVEIRVIPFISTSQRRNGSQVEGVNDFSGFSLDCPFSLLKPKTPEIASNDTFLLLAKHLTSVLVDCESEFRMSEDVYYIYQTFRCLLDKGEKIP